VNVTAAVALVLRPVLISAAILVAAVAWSAPAQADPVDSSFTNVLGNAGVGDSGLIVNAIAQMGQAICPLLVQPGSDLASGATQLSGNGGLAPTIAGAVTGMAIQATCPNAMTQLANGNIAPLLQLLGMANAPASPFGLPGAGVTSPLPLSLPAAANPLPVLPLS
jgi:hypothetical protein